MALLVEFILVVVRKAILERDYPGGGSQVAADWRIPVSVADDDLVSFGFMNPTDAIKFATGLKARNIASEEIAIVDHVNGVWKRASRPCAWLQFGNLEILSGHTVQACWLAGSEITSLVAPSHWKPGDECESLRIDLNDPRYRLDRTDQLEGGGSVNVYVDVQTGTEYYVGRPSLPANSAPGSSNIVKKAITKLRFHSLADLFRKSKSRK